MVLLLDKSALIKERQGAFTCCVLARRKLFVHSSSDLLMLLSLSFDNRVVEAGSKALLRSSAMVCLFSYVYTLTYIAYSVDICLSHSSANDYVSLHRLT